MKKHFLLILGALAMALGSWALIEFAELSNKQVVGGFVAAWIGFTFELVGFLLLERSETERKIETIKTSLDHAGTELEGTKGEAKDIQQHVASLAQNIQSLEQSIKQDCWQRRSIIRPMSGERCSKMPANPSIQSM